MYECPNCGMLPFACVCVPWCWRHDRPRPCKPCEMDPEPESAVGWIVTGVVILLLLVLVFGLIAAKRYGAP